MSDQTNFEFAAALEWEYCECGCHGSKLAGVPFALTRYRYIDFPGWKPDSTGCYRSPEHELVLLKDGHGALGGELSRWDSRKGIKDPRAACDAYVREELIKLRDALTAALQGKR